jgi:hypothetical protein
VKSIKYILFVIIGSLFLTACKDVAFLNLTRDNPLDEKNNANMQDGVALKFNSFSVYSDNNNDGTINKGETVTLNIGLKNTGTKTAKNVKATFSTTSSYVSGLSPATQITYGDISANGVKWASYTGFNIEYESAVDYTIRFTVSNSTPENTQIPISISMVDENGNTWTALFNVTVSATEAQISYNRFSVYSDNNGDKIINKGETVYLRISLKNAGTSAAKSVKATFSTTSSYVSGLSPAAQITYGDISANGVKWASYTGFNIEYESAVDYTIRFTVSNSTPANTQIPISIRMVDESGNTWTDNFNVIVSATGAQVSYNSYRVYSDNNGDKIVNKGETVYLKISLKNTGTSAAKSVKTTFSTTSSYVSGFSPAAQITYGDISANGVKWASYTGFNIEYESAVDYTIRFTVSNSTPTNTQIPISIRMADESNNIWSSSFNVTVQ